MTIDRFLAHQRQLARAAEARRREIAAAIRARLPAVVEELVRQGAVRIILFGSVARGECEEDSDVDLAVEGMPSGRLFDAMARAWALAGRPVDLVRLDEASPSLRDRILAEGEVLRHAG